MSSRRMCSGNAWMSDDCFTNVLNQPKQCFRCSFVSRNICRNTQIGCSKDVPINDLNVQWRKCSGNDEWQVFEPTHNIALVDDMKNNGSEIAWIAEKLSSQRGVWRYFLKKFCSKASTLIWIESSLDFQNCENKLRSADHWLYLWLCIADFFLHITAANRLPGHKPTSRTPISLTVNIRSTPRERPPRCDLKYSFGRSVL